MDKPNAGNPITGGVDENLKVHGLSNLHACDLSVFPYSVESNRSISLAALSLRTAEHTCHRITILKLKIEALHTLVCPSHVHCLLLCFPVV